MKSRFKENENSDKTNQKNFFVDVLYEKKEFTDPVSFQRSS